MKTTTNLVVSEQIPDRSLIYQNYVFISISDAKDILPQDYEKSSNPNYIQINDNQIFIVRTHQNQKVGEIGMSSVVRDSANLIIGSPCSIKLWFPNSDNNNNFASRMRFQVNVFREKKRLEIQEEVLMKMIKTNFMGYVFSRDQKIVVGYNSPHSLTEPTAIVLQLLHVEVPMSIVAVPFSKTTDTKYKDKNTKDTKDTRDTKEIVMNSMNRTLDDALTASAISSPSQYGIITPSTQIECEPNKENRYLIWEKSRMSMLLKPGFKFADMNIGGLDEEFANIFRRAFVSRLFPPSIIAKLGINHVRGLLLYGPPGTGKTLIAREISKMLNCTEPIIKSGPEILNQFVGASEANIRALFAPAENEYKEKGDASNLHVIILDEIDSICRPRGTDRSGTAVHDTIVNQLIAKIDGVNSLNNILIIGMTNRKDMIDPAVLRPGRLEVHVEIGLPDDVGRLQIFKIHTRKMRENNLLGSDVDLEQLVAQTKNFSGAEIEGIVKNATSFALYGHVDTSKNVPTVNPDIIINKNNNNNNNGKKIGSTIKITMDHFCAALNEYIPAFGVAEDELKTYLRDPIVNWGPDYLRIFNTSQMLVKQVSESSSTPLLSALIEGPSGSGKTSLAAKIALDSGFPYVKLITPDNFIGMSEQGKIVEINKIFEDAYKSSLSLIIVDDIERLLNYVSIGQRFSNDLLQTLLILLKKIPPTDDRRLMILATTSKVEVLKDMDIPSAFNVIMSMPQLKTTSDISNVLTSMMIPDDDLNQIARDYTPLPISIKEFTMIIQMAKQRTKEEKEKEKQSDSNTIKITPSCFIQCVKECTKGKTLLKKIEKNKIKKKITESDII